MGDAFKHEMHGALVPVEPAKPASLSSEKVSLVSTGVGSVGGLLQMPAIFDKLDGQRNPSVPGSHGCMGEDALLDSSMQYVSKVALKPQVKKKPCGKKKAKKKAQGHKGHIEKPMKVQKAAVEKSPPCSGSKALCFHSSHWGKCKLEIYKEKSYIRYLDITSNKWKQLIGSVVAEIHGDVRRKLVPHVTPGLCVPDLYKKRGEIVEELTQA